LSITNACGGTDIFDFQKFLQQAEGVDKTVITDTTFYSATFK
jgi:hypothetical protein